MKKIFLLCAALLITTSVPLIAQQKASGLPDVFVKTISIVKVYTHELGFKILFIDSRQNVGTFYVPIKWFGHSAGKGETVFETPGTPPYFSIFWEDGKFSHIVLHVDSNSSSLTWGVLTTNEDLKDAFNIEEPQLVY